jgi:hypothetical protein
MVLTLSLRRPYAALAMPEPGSILAAGLTILMIGVVLWFALGTQRNIRRGNDLLKWIQTGLPELGQKTTLKWVGSSVVQLDITDPQPPFSQAQILVVLEPRDVGLLWMLSRRKGRRDFVIIRSRLQRSPQFELEAGDTNQWTGRDRLMRLDSGAWQRDDWRDGQIEIAFTREADVEGVRAAWDELDSVSGGMWRLSVRRDAPHLEVHLAPPAERDTSSSIFLAYRRLAQKSTARR